MINWNDIHVEQEIARERYQTIIEARQTDRILSQPKDQQPTSLFYDQILGWMGRQFISLGQTLQQRSKAASSQC